MTKKVNEFAGQFQIIKGANKKFRFRLIDSNGEILIESGEFNTLRGCKSAIIKMKTLVPKAHYIDFSKFLDRLEETTLEVVNYQFDEIIRQAEHKRSLAERELLANYNNLIELSRKIMSNIIPEKFTIQPNKSVKLDDDLIAKRNFDGKIVLEVYE